MNLPSDRGFNDRDLPDRDLPTRGLLVFDLDGTLVDTLDDLAASANRLLASLDRPGITPDRLRPMVGDGVPTLVRRILADAKLATDEDAAIGRFTDDYGSNAANASRCFPGVAEVLGRLSDGGWRLAVCTNKPEAAARSLLAALHILPRLAAVGGGDSFPTRKPDPGHLLGTIRAAGGDRSRALLVGDHANDVAAGLGAGIPCIFAAWGYGAPSMAEGCAAVAQDMAQVAELAASLLPA